jgi:hypothetical protein
MTTVLPTVRPVSASYFQVGAVCLIVWEPHSHLACQEIARLLWNLKIHYHVYMRQLLGPILSQMNPVNIIIPSFLKIQVNIDLSRVFRSPKWSSSFYPNIILYIVLISPMCAHYLPLFYYSNNTWCVTIRSQLKESITLKWIKLQIWFYYIVANLKFYIAFWILCQYNVLCIISAALLISELQFL